MSYLIAKEIFYQKQLKVGLNKHKREDLGSLPLSLVGLDLFLP